MALLPALSLWLNFVCANRWRCGERSEKSRIVIVAVLILAAILLASLYFRGYVWPPDHPAAPSPRLAVRTAVQVLALSLAVTHILSTIEQGDPHAAEQLLPVVYDEFRKLAAQKLALEKPGQTLQATALVHEAYVRLVDHEKVQHWNSRGHFFAAAAEAMRRILVERARSKAREKRGGDWRRVNFEELDIASSVSAEQLVALDDARERLTALDCVAGELVKLRYFARCFLSSASRSRRNRARS